MIRILNLGKTFTGHAHIFEGFETSQMIEKFNSSE
jgi:hypothetical protein